MTAEISEQDRFANSADVHLVGRLRTALAALTEPWIVLATRRASGTDGPPWVRYVVLHPDKGIALVDIDDAGPAIAPLDDFLWHTGFAALQDGALCIVAVMITAKTSDTVVDEINAAFGGSPCGLANPNWCEAVVDLLLATPDLMLVRLRPSAPAPAPAAVAAPAVPSGGEIEIRKPHVASPLPVALSAPARERWRAMPESMPPQPTWRNWPISPVAAAMTLLALGTVALVSRQASPPADEVANTRPTAHVASAATLAAAAPSPSASAVVPLPVPAPPGTPSGNGTSAKIPPVRTATIVQPKPIPQRPTVEHQVRRPVTPSTPVAPSRQVAQVASANTTRAVCADVLHPGLPGGWQYRGPAVPQCLPIRFFGLIGMR
ncbi:MAG: hypothetical protein ACREEI_01170 [Stellaceae bacterium]